MEPFAGEDACTGRADAHDQSSIVLGTISVTGVVICADRDLQLDCKCGKLFQEWFYAWARRLVRLLPV